MYLDVFSDNSFETNCWLLGADGTDEVVGVDPGVSPARVRALLGRLPPCTWRSPPTTRSRPTAGCSAPTGPTRWWWSTPGSRPNASARCWMPRGGDLAPRSARPGTY